MTKTIKAFAVSLFILMAVWVSFGVSKHAYFAGTYWVGTGSGSLTISASYLAGSTIIIKSGTYTGITVTGETSIKIMNDSAGPIIFNGFGTGWGIQNCNYVHITRNPSPIVSTPYGFIHENNTYRGDALSGSNNYDTIEYNSYIGLGDNSITYGGSATTWDGTFDATVQSYGLSFRNLLFDSTDGSCMELAVGSLSTGAVTGLLSGVEIAYCQFRWCDPGDLVFCQPLNAYNIHDDQFYNCNYTNNDDNGLFHITGSGSIHNVLAQNCQGHMIRMWTLAFGATPYTDSAYNCIYIGSRKYSMFEWQSTLGDNIPAAPNTTYCNVTVVNNIGGDLNYQQNTSFDAALVDDYQMNASSVEKVYNNLLFNTYTSNGAAGRMFQFGPNPAVDSAKDWYYSNSAGAGFDTVALYLLSGSPAYHAGISGQLLSTTDYHGTAWITGTPSIGAVAGFAPVPPPTPGSYFLHKRGHKY